MELKILLATKHQFGSEIGMETGCPWIIESPKRSGDRPMRNLYRGDTKYIYLLFGDLT
jgi:hypothetical protein